MASISIPLSKTEMGKIRPIRIMHDLPKIADLVELCFKHNMDGEGKRYVQQMRRASQNAGFLNWASNSPPLTGYVWGEEKQIVGNISIVPFRKKGIVFLLANIAVHPDFRRRGIARLLTQKGMEHARQRRAESIWLQVEDDNPSAIKLYENLGFQTRARRTTWDAVSEPDPRKVVAQTIVTSRAAHFWEQQHRGLAQAYPEEITWYRMPDWEIFKPGLKYWLYRLFVESDVRQWVAQKDGKFQAALIWRYTRARRSPLWLASAPQADSETLASLLLHARLHLASQRRDFYIDYPAGELTEAFEAAGFASRRTLLWMRAES